MKQALLMVLISVWFFSRTTTVWYQMDSCGFTLTVLKKKQQVNLVVKQGF